MATHSIDEEMLSHFVAVTQREQNIENNSYASQASVMLPSAATSPLIQKGKIGAPTHLCLEEVL